MGVEETLEQIDQIVFGVELQGLLGGGRTTDRAEGAIDSKLRVVQIVHLGLPAPDRCLLALSTEGAVDGKAGGIGRIQPGLELLDAGLLHQAGELRLLDDPSGSCSVGRNRVAEDHLVAQCVALAVDAVVLVLLGGVGGVPLDRIDLAAGDRGDHSDMVGVLVQIPVIEDQIARLGNVAALGILEPASRLEEGVDGHAAAGEVGDHSGGDTAHPSDIGDEHGAPRRSHVEGCANGFVVRLDELIIPGRLGGPKVLSCGVHHCGTVVDSHNRSHPFL